MPDNVDPPTRSRMMAGIRAIDTGPELTVRRFLHSCGLRFRLHDKKLPGRPDIVLTRWNAVVQVQGCFWHAHEGCPYFVLPSTRKLFWKEKLLRNRERDFANEAALIEAGWRVATVWECALRSDAESSLRRLASWVRAGEPSTIVLSR